MPLQNRVSPFGEIFATTARGTFMGNRGGALHNGEREIVRRYASRRWITCVLEFRGRQRIVMSPNRYTELFFLDEAVSLAAGHRPCAECRHERFGAFKHAWNPGREGFLYVDEIDRELHQARIDRRKMKVTFSAPLNTLPDGCFVQIDGACYLVWGDSLFRWTPHAYVEKRERSGSAPVDVLTPEPLVRCLHNGFTPEVHRSFFEL
jgi:hypothetical protein